MNNKANRLNFIIALSVLAAVFVIFRFASCRNNTIVRKFSPYLAEQRDTVIVNDSLNLDIFSNTHRINVLVTPNIRFFSYADTLLSVYDTVGNRIIDYTRIRDLNLPDQYRIKETLLYKK